jgi:2-polyprenyl-6-methoxyphenol hydroxylase-like FAD-dependent oxidoreductase
MAHQPPVIGQVLIVGAGAAGLTLACNLRRQGVACRVVDKLDVPFAGSRGKGLQPRTMEVFDALGIAEEMTCAGGPFPLFRGYAGQAVAWERDLAQVLGLAPLEPGPSAPFGMWMVPQYRTEAVLRARLRELGGDVEMSTELMKFEQHAEHVQVQLRSPRGVEEADFAYVVGADGGRSALRQQLGIAFIGETGTYRSVIADVRVEGLERGRWHIWTRSQDSLDRLALCALPGTDLFQFSAPIDASISQVELSWLRDTFLQRAAGHPARIKECVWSTVYRLNVRLAERFRVGRVMLAGDAAHVHSPFGGQGINTSIQDAYNLGWKLEAALRGVHAPLDAYEAERLPVAAHVLGLSNGLQSRQYARQTQADPGSGDTDIYQLKHNYCGGPLSLCVCALQLERNLRPGESEPVVP